MLSYRILKIWGSLQTQRLSLKLLHCPDPQTVDNWFQQQSTCAIPGSVVPSSNANFPLNLVCGGEVTSVPLTDSVDHKQVRNTGGGPLLASHIPMGLQLASLRDEPNIHLCP